MTRFKDDSNIMLEIPILMHIITSLLSIQGRYVGQVI